MSVGPTRHAERSRRRPLVADRRAALLVLGALTVALFVGWRLQGAAAPACAAGSSSAGNSQVEVGLLVLAENPSDALAPGWRLQLESEGVPSRWEFLKGRALTARMLESDGPRDGIVVLPTAARRLSGTSEERLLKRTAAQHGERIAWYEQGSWSSASITQQSRHLRPGPAGAPAWNYLRGVSAAGSDRPATPVLTAGGDPVITTDATGRELLVRATLAQMRSGEPLVRHGVIVWLAAGRPWVGAWQPSLSVHVDDVLLSSATWDVSRQRPTNQHEVRMSAADLRAAANWSRRWRMPLDLAINGAGAGGDPCEPLLRALHSRRQDFRLINHTFSHQDLDGARTRTIVHEIVDNVQFARKAGLTLEHGGLITGGHTGIGNRDFAAAMAESGTKVVGTDASRRQPAAIRGVSWVPRLPLGLAYDAPTIELQVDEWRHTGHPACATESCTKDVASAWRRGRQFESDQLFAHAMAGDPRPFYAHQANLMVDLTLQRVLEPALRMVGAYLDRRLAHPSLTELAMLRTRAQRASAALSEGGVRVERRGGILQLSSSKQVSIPVSMLTADGEKVQWVEVIPGHPVRLGEVRASSSLSSASGHHEH